MIINCCMWISLIIFFMKHVHPPIHISPGPSLALLELFLIFSWHSGFSESFLFSPHIPDSFLWPFSSWMTTENYLFYGQITSPFDDIFQVDSNDFLKYGIFHIFKPPPTPLLPSMIDFSYSNLNDGIILQTPLYAVLSHFSWTLWSSRFDFNSWLHREDFLFSSQETHFNLISDVIVSPLASSLLPPLLLPIIVSFTLSDLQDSLDHLSPSN